MPVDRPGPGRFGTVERELVLAWRNQSRKALGLTAIVVLHLLVDSAADQLADRDPLGEDFQGPLLERLAGQGGVANRQRTGHSCLRQQYPARFHQNRSLHCTSGSSSKQTGRPPRRTEARFGSSKRA